MSVCCCLECRLKQNQTSSEICFFNTTSANRWKFKTLHSQVQGRVLIPFNLLLSDGWAYWQDTCPEDKLDSLQEKPEPQKVTGCPLSSVSKHIRRGLTVGGWELCRKRCTSCREDRCLEKSDKQKFIQELVGASRATEYGHSQEIEKKYGKKFHWMKSGDTQNPSCFHRKPFWALLVSVLPTSFVQTLICTSSRTWSTEPEL